jgi:hypothetical protein
LLVTAALAKATDSRIHYQSLKKKESDLDGAYGPRNISKTVVSPWNMEIGNRLGASTEPLAGNPTQSTPVFLPEPNVDRPELRRHLSELLGEFQEETESGKLDEVEILRAVLNEVAELPQRRSEFSPVLGGLRYQTVVDGVGRFLTESGKGERLMAVTAGILETCYQGPEEEYSVCVGHANAADQPRESVGDVWLDGPDEVLIGAEVKHTKATVNDVNIAVDKAKKAELRQYLFIAERYTDLEAVQEIARDESIDLVVATIDELLAWLQPLGHERRAQAINRIGESLLEMQATPTNIDAWELVKSAIDDESVEDS